MPGMIVELDEISANKVRQMAASLDRSTDKVASEVVANGIEMMSRYAAMKERAKTVDVEQVIQTLRSKRNDNPPDPWDIVPNDLKDRVAEPKNVDVSDALEILSRAGKGNPPDPWDELPEDLKR